MAQRLFLGIRVIGGGDSAMEEAHFLTKYGSKVYILHTREVVEAYGGGEKGNFAGLKIRNVVSGKVSDFEDAWQHWRQNIFCKSLVLNRVRVTKESAAKLPSKMWTLDLLQFHPDTNILAANHSCHVCFTRDM
ncbi:hypothetical protein AgCh_005716 [Apium graveolens]